MIQELKYETNPFQVEFLGCKKPTSIKPVDR